MKRQSYVKIIVNFHSRSKFKMKKTNTNQELNSLPSLITQILICQCIKAAYETRLMIDIQIYYLVFDSSWMNKNVFSICYLIRIIYLIVNVSKNDISSECYLMGLFDLAYF